MGSVFMRYATRRWYVRFRTATGWTQQPTDLYGEDQERAARRVLARVEARVSAGIDMGHAGPMTISDWAGRWCIKRRKLDIGEQRNDESRLRDHVLPVIGDVRIDQVRPRHVMHVVDRIRASHAPKTVRNVYSVMRAMFRDAQIEDLLETNPCILTRHQLGELRDRDPGWRQTARFHREEFVSLISDERIPMDRRVWYATLGLGGLRHGEAAGLRWQDYDTSTTPLARITVARSYDHRWTKTRRTRYVPAHPTLAAMLAEWRLHGWADAMGRQPQPGDLVFPTTVERGTRIPRGSMRTKNYSRRRWEIDLEALGLRHRRNQDLRRTMISIALQDGAHKALLELVTHTPKHDAAIDEYVTIEWASLCCEISKIQVFRRPVEVDQACFALASSDAEALDLKGFTSGGAGNRTQLLTCITRDGCEFESKLSYNLDAECNDILLDDNGCDFPRSKRSKTVILSADDADRIAAYLRRLADTGDDEADDLLRVLAAAEGGVR